ncbi:5-formyltetrahydrofolate cyclo-ligase [Sphingobium subterraneum]|uniref:5-formyltetrahydrofolate cyclo-ligase n=1 Tax=Sphingobium subterraneum TaxID=627688 RepID=UPI001618A0E8|nr:5-formyltetrahydrofolate cyclo-ligase [Sphingobium subterraneum]
MTDKAALRLQARGLRSAFVADLDPMAHRLAFRALPTPLRVMLDDANTVALYVPKDDEAPALRLAEALVASGKRLCLPRVIDRIGTMDFRAWMPGDPLDEGRFGTRHPAEGAEALHPDAIIAPLIAFDAAMTRLGQGGGYYDRAFARYEQALRIGLAWSVQQMDDLPVDPWDLPLHAVLTERSFIESDREPAA